MGNHKDLLSILSEADRLLLGSDKAYKTLSEMLIKCPSVDFQCEQEDIGKWITTTSREKVAIQAAVWSIYAERGDIMLALSDLGSLLSKEDVKEVLFSIATYKSPEQDLLAEYQRVMKVLARGSLSMDFAKHFIAHITDFSDIPSDHYREILEVIDRSIVGARDAASSLLITSEKALSILSETAVSVCVGKLLEPYHQSVFVANYKDESKCEDVASIAKNKLFTKENISLLSTLYSSVLVRGLSGSMEDRAADFALPWEGYWEEGFSVEFKNNLSELLSSRFVSLVPDLIESRQCGRNWAKQLSSIIYDVKGSAGVEILLKAVIEYKGEEADGFIQSLSQGIDRNRVVDLAVKRRIEKVTLDSEFCI